jgi:site-specific DNA-methyltransferase (adenine-specific)/modification methylase
LGRFDLLLTDPPYGIGHQKQATGKGRHHRRNTEKICGDNAPFNAAEWLNFTSVIIWGANHFSSQLPHGRWLAWNKLADLEPWDSFSDVEFAWQNTRAKDRIFSMLWKGIASDRGGEGKGHRGHPTQKPVRLMKWCLSLVPDATTILDPFAGSGTTGVAAKLEGRKATLIEMEERYCEIAANRLSQGVLF